MSLNAVTFPSPTVAMVTFDTNIANATDSAFRYFSKKGIRPSKQGLLKLKSDIKVIQSNVNALTAYVNTVADGKPEIVRLAGMATNPEIKNVKKLGPVTNLRQNINTSVTVNHCQLSWHKPSGSKTRKGIMYRVQVSPVGHPNIIREIGITGKTFLTFDVGDLNVIGAVVRVTPVGGAPSAWLNVKGQF